MKKRTVSLALVVLATLLAPAPAAVAGSITGATFATPDPQDPFKLRATVIGTGACDFFGFIWGDGSPVIHYARPLPATIPPPQEPPHHYPKAGTYTALVFGESTCQGQVSVKVEVGGILGIPSYSKMTGVKVVQPVPPAASKVGDPVRVNLEGYGICDFFLSWGDDPFSARQRHAIPMLGIEHTYTRAGTFTIKAWDVPPGPCGTASATIVVNGPLVKR